MRSSILICILIIALLVFIGFILKSLNEDDFSNEDKELFNIDQEGKMEGGQAISKLPANIMKKLDVKWPKVGIISNFQFSITPLTSFLWSEKTDGEHKNLLLLEGKLYDVTKPLEPVEIGRVSTDKTFILDTEFLDDKYWIFDAYIVDSKDVSKSLFEDRMKSIESYIDELGDQFIMKTFSKVPSIQYLIDFLKNDKSPTTGTNIDGVILQRNDLPYFVEKKNFTVFKMKARYLSTIDFLMKYDGKMDAYELYLIGSYSDMLYNLKQRPRFVKVIHTVDGQTIPRERSQKLPASLYILFDAPYYADLHIYKNEEKWNSHGYSRRYINEANFLIAEMKKVKGSFDGKIVEMSLNEDNKWIPLRIRTDKEKPNGYIVGLGAIGQAFDQIKSPDEIYFQKDLSAENKLQTYVHGISHTYKTYVAEKYIWPRAYSARKFGHMYEVSLLDLAAGRGADLVRFINNGISNVFAVDADTTALHQYVDRAPILRNANYEPLTRKVMDSTPKHLSLNVLNHTLGLDYSDLLKDIGSRFEYKGRFQIINMWFAIHYLCDNKKKIEALSKFIASQMDKYSVFICMFYDGDEILKMANEQHKGKALKNVKVKVGSYEITIVESSSTKTIARMPLPTIQGGEDSYREEPLATSSMLKELEKSLELKTSVNMYIEAKAWIDAFKDPGDYLPYYKLITCNIYGLPHSIIEKQDREKAKTKRPYRRIIRHDE